MSQNVFETTETSKMYVSKHLKHLKHPKVWPIIQILFIVLDYQTYL